MISRTSMALFAALIAASVAVGAEMRIVKVQALSDGSIMLDGRHTTVEELQRILAGAPRQVTVWYYRDHPDQDPTEGQMKVIEAIAENSVPISLSSKPDFSDYIDVHGQSHPREHPI